MRVAVLSGKGGAGKTLLAVNLAYAAGQSAYIDCDVEEPNGHLFFKPAGVTEEDVAVKIPSVDETRCCGCRKCVDFCRFNALAFVKNRPHVFEELCHSCGGCIILCPTNALREKERVIGKIQRGRAGGTAVISGFLNPGEVSGVPIIRKLINRNSPRGGLVIIDCPPGCSCAVMESIKDSDYCVLVAEPTTFGVHNLGMVHELVRQFKKPFGVVLNKCLGSENPAEKYCHDNRLKILGKIPYDARLGEISSNAEISAAVSEKYRALFDELLGAVMEEAPG